eukprot:2952989-Amphidinium_carterae.1
MSLNAEEQDTLRRFAAETAEKYTSNHEFFSLGSQPWQLALMSVLVVPVATLLLKRVMMMTTSPASKRRRRRRSQVWRDPKSSHCAVEERKLTSTLESTVAASKELQAFAAPLSQLEADIHDSHRKTLYFRVKVASFVLGVEPKVVCEFVKLEGAEEGNEAAAEEVDAAQPAAAEPSQLHGVLAKHKAAAVAQFQE